MNGDLGLQQNITGVNPDPEKHSSAFVIQPVCLSLSFDKFGFIQYCAQPTVKNKILI